MKFNALDESEIFEKQLLRSGVYNYEIEDAAESTSSAGNEMIVLTVRVSANGQSKVLTDYLVGVGRGLAKLRSCAKVCGLLDKYNSGILSADDFPGHKGKLKLGIDRDKSGRYAPKNIIVEYLS